MAKAQRESRSQGKEISRTSAGSPTYLEQISNALCRTVEGAESLIHHAQTVDGHLRSWLKVRITGRELPDGIEIGSPQLIKHGNQWWLHTPVEKQFKSPGKIEKQVTTNAQTKICAIDLNINEHLAVCTIQTVEGTILATTFIGGGREISGFRKKQLGRIARNRRKTGILAKGEQDNGALWKKIGNGDESISHLVSARIVQFAKEHEATILVFEHLGNLKPAKGKYSRRGNSKRAFWMKGRIFSYNLSRLPVFGVLGGGVGDASLERRVVLGLGLEGLPGRG